MLRSLQLALCLLLVVLGLNRPQAYSQEVAAPAAPEYVYLSRAFSVPFEPVRVLFFISWPTGESQRFPGVIVLDDTLGADRLRSGITGTRITGSIDLAKATIGAFLEGNSGELQILEPQEYTVSEADQFTQSVDGLRAYLLNRKDVLKSWQLQVRTQEESLDRLRADADIIANLGRIVEVKEDAQRFRQEALALDKDIANLQRLFSYTRGKSSPKNFIGRESQLSKQISELKQLLSTVDTKHGSQRTEREQELQRKLALIERTRFDDYDALQRELVRLRHQRLMLEGKS